MKNIPTTYSRLMLMTLATVMILVIMVPVTLMAHAQTQEESQNECPNSANGVKIEPSIASSGIYYVWALIRTDTDNVTSSLKIEEGTCDKLTQPEPKNWQWVTYSSEQKGVYLTQGKNTIELLTAGGKLYAESILLTNDPKCIPIGSGSNCRDEVIDFEVSGLSAGNVVDGILDVRANILNQPFEDVSVSFSIDGQTPIVRSTGPYCYSEKCSDGLDTNLLAEGEHKLLVVASHPEGQHTELHIPFIVERRNPENGSRPPNDTTKITINGIKEGATVRDTINIFTEVKPKLTQGAVNYTLDGEILGSAMSNPPYCLVQTASTTKCGDLDTKILRNGEYRLTATQGNLDTAEIQSDIRFKVNNAGESSGIGDHLKDVRNIVTVGSPDTRILSDIIIAPPAGYPSKNNTVSYTLNGVELTRVNADDPHFQIPADSLRAGTNVLSATVPSNNLGKKVFASTIYKESSFIDSAVRDRSFLMSTLGVIIIVAGIVSYVWIRQKRYGKRKKHRSERLVIISVVVGLALVIGGILTKSASTVYYSRVGYITKLSTHGSFSQGNHGQFRHGHTGENEGRAYIILSDRDFNSDHDSH